HVHGDAAGARWVLATTDAKLDAPVVRAIVSRALEGAYELRALPTRATVDEGAAAEIRVVEQRWRGTPASARAHVAVTDAAGRAEHAAAAAPSGAGLRRHA